MELEQLDELEPGDQWTFPLGRISSEAVEMEAQLRGLHARLHGAQDTRAALFMTPWRWSDLVRGCRTGLASIDVDDDVRAAIEAAIEAARQGYDERSAYLHRQLIRREVWDDEQPPPDVPVVSAPGDRLRVTLSNPDGEPLVERVTLDEAKVLVGLIVGAAWRLRFARHYLVRGRRWRGALLGHVVGDWNGNADLVEGPDDDD